MGAGARRAREYSAEIRLKASQTRGLLLPFIFAMSPYLIRFDRDRASQLRDAVTLGMSFLYIRAPATKIAKKKPTATKTPTHLGFTSSAATPPRLLHPVHRRASAIERAGLRNRRPQRSCTGRGRIWFLGSDLRDCLLALSSSSPRLVYLFIGLARRIVAFNANFVRPIVVFIQSSSSRNRKSRTVPALKSCLTYFIC
jgi:hypothetical protein